MCNRFIFHRAFLVSFFYLVVACASQPPLQQTPPPNAGSATAVADLPTSPTPIGPPATEPPTEGQQSLATATTIQTLAVSPALMTPSLSPDGARSPTPTILGSQTTQSPNASAATTAMPLTPSPSGVTVALAASPPLSTQAPGSDGGCQVPVEDYTRVVVNGQTINRRTELMLEAAVGLYDGLGDLKRLTQGSYSESEAASFGTHSGGGVVDISIRNPANPAVYLFEEVEPMVQALRRAGFAAWYRALDDLYPGSPPHIHAVGIGDRELSSAAQQQLTGPEGYFRGLNGLPETPQPDRHGGPVICPWMLELGYADLR
jgi:hypothetical protein